MVFIALISATTAVVACGGSEPQVAGSDVVPEPTGTPVLASVGGVYSVGEGSLRSQSTKNGPDFLCRTILSSALEKSQVKSTFQKAMPRW